MPEILQKLFINLKSKKAKLINKVIIICEDPAMEGEEKYYTTSLESMVDFFISKLGKNVMVISTKNEKKKLSYKNLR